MRECLTATACLQRLRQNLSEDVSKRKPRKKNLTIAGAKSGLDDEVGEAPKGLNVCYIHLLLWQSELSVFQFRWFCNSRMHLVLQDLLRK